MKNHQFVAETNAKNQTAGKSLRLEINSYADMTFKEFIALKGGYMPEKKVRNFATNLGDEPTATSVDWRNKAGIVNEVQNQQQCGSCWAFSATAAVESRHAISSGKLLKLAEQQLVDCDRD